MRIDSSSDGRRRRQLAGDDRTGVWVRRQNRAQRLHVLRANSRSFSGALVIASFVVAGVAVLIPSGFDRGLFVGISATVALGSVAYMVLAVSGTVAPGMGATAEAWTASELRPLRRHGWSVVNGLPLAGRDIDHVLVGPAGVIVVESKWSAYGWKLEPPDDHARQAVAQASVNARTLRLWDAVKSSGAPVRTLVVLWGGGRVGAPERRAEPIRAGDDITIVYGLTAIRTWVRSLFVGGERLISDADAQQVWQSLERVVSERERVDPSAAPPSSFDRMLWTGVATVVLFIAAVLASLELVAVSRSWTVWAGGSAVLIGVALALRRFQLARVPATGALVGLAAVAVLASVSAVTGLAG